MFNAFPQYSSSKTFRYVDPTKYFNDLNSSLTVTQTDEACTLIGIIITWKLISKKIEQKKNSIQLLIINLICERIEITLLKHDSKLEL